MQITRNLCSDHLEIKLKGRMDGSWSDHVGQALSESVQSGQHIIALDMSEVDYISSAGIRILVIYSKQLRSIQGRFHITNASPMVRKVLELSGLQNLFTAAKGGATSQTHTPKTGQIQLAHGGAMAEVFQLDAKASLQAHWPGNPQSWLSGSPSMENAVTVEFPNNTIGLGLGALGDSNPDSPRRFGEYLAAGGAAVCQPADGSNKPDYVVTQGALMPTMKVGYGMLGCGGFRHLLRFDKGPELPSLPFSDIVRASLQVSGSSAIGLVLVAETASLIGASMKNIPAGLPKSDKGSPLFTFPGVRQWLSFTAEAAFSSTTSLIVGFAAAQSEGEKYHLLRPLVPGGEILGHFHAIAFPYQPLRKGQIELTQTVRSLFDTGQLLGLLHLLNDWREISGSGESRFLRGACWCSPLNA